MELRGDPEGSGFIDRQTRGYKKVKIVIAGGGTGGHIYPGIAVVESIKQFGYEPEVMLVGSGRGLERKVASSAGFEIFEIVSRPLPVRFGIKSILSILSALVGLIQSFVILLVYRPRVIIATGGYASGPCVLAGKMLGIPVVLIEPNVIPGRTTRMLARFVDQIALGYKEAVRYFKRGTNLRVTGVPTRISIIKQNREQATDLLGLDPSRKTIFVFGGSRGASSINRAFIGAAKILESRKDLQFLIQTGKRDYSMVLNAINALDVRCKVFEYVDNIGIAYRASDLIVSRAGAATIAEINAIGLPSILIPYPYALGEHQKANATILAEHGAALVIEDRELTPHRLAEAILDLISDQDKLNRMSQRSLELGRQDAANDIAAHILDLVKQDIGLKKFASMVVRYVR